MSLIADGVLIIACLTTAIYCFVLSRRLRSLSGMEDGIGLQIKQLNTALDETRVAIKNTRASAKTASDRLSREVAEARLTAQRLNQLVQGTSGTASEDESGLPSSRKPVVVDRSFDERPSATRGSDDASSTDDGGGDQTELSADEGAEEIAYNDARLAIDSDSDPFSDLSTEAGAESNGTRVKFDDDSGSGFDDDDVDASPSKEPIKIERMAL